MKKASIFLFITMVFLISNPTLIYADLFISSYSTNSIQRYDVQSQAFVKIIEGLNNPQKILFGPDNNLYVINYNTNTIKRYDGQNYQFIDDFVSPMFPGQIRWIESLAFGPDDNLYVLSRGTSSVFRYNGQTGELIDTFTSGSEFNVPHDLAFGPNGNLYITNAGTNKIEYYHGQTGDYLGTFINTGNAVTDIDFGVDGNLYAYEQTERILRYDGQSGDFIDVFVSVKAGDFIFGPDKDLYVSLASGYGVNHYNGQTGTFIETLSGGVCPFPTGIAFRLFIDVPPDYWAEEAIYKIYNAGITTGCSQTPLKYCPNNFVTRTQMAVFLGRAKNGSSFTPPPATGIFSDVPVSYWAADWIEQFYRDGITTGCNTNPPRYCPYNNVTRAQMAIFLLRAKHGSSYTPPPATGIFIDVPVSYWAADWIEQLYNEGITTGCATGPLRYCPDSSVTRAQMAVFITRTFGL